MDNAADVAYRVADVLATSGSAVPWWAWVAPFAMVFGRLMMPMVAPESAGPGDGKSGKGGKKGKKAKK